MPVLLQLVETLCIGIGNKLIFVQLTNGDTVSHDLPPIVTPENLSKAQEDLFKETPIITTLSTSNDGLLLVVSTHNRQVVTFDTKSFTPVSNFIINRAASKICFDKVGNIIVADKTGDAYLYKKDQEPNLLLGHLSMLLDIVMSPCGKFIITSDRDEKIRISHYPNCYNILCYCLGHQEFVTNLAIINDQLLSASGDGTLRLWDYKKGMEMFQVNTNSVLCDSTNMEQFKDLMEKDNVEVNALPVTDMQVFEYKTGFALIGITLIQLNNIEVYEFNYDTQKIHHIQRLSVPDGAVLVAFSLSSNLCILTKDELILYNYDVSVNKFVLSSLETNVFKLYQDVFDKYLSKTHVSLLYKRKFDNVQEYLDRKKQRLEAK